MTTTTLHSPLSFASPKIPSVRLPRWERRNDIVINVSLAVFATAAMTAAVAAMIAWI